MNDTEKYQLPDTLPPSGETGAPLTRKECREIITPYAFEVCPSLLGVPTASPLRRAIAIAVDGAIITGLAKSALLAIVPVFAFLIYFRWRAEKFKQVVLLALVAVVWSMSGSFFPEFTPAVEEQESHVISSPKVAMLVAASALKLQQEECDTSCMKAILTELSTELKQAGLNRAQAKDMLDELVSSTDYPKEQWRHDRKVLLKSFQDTDAADTVAAAPATSVKAATPASTDAQQPWYKPDANTYSILSWIKGILADVGIGFGWAAAYFTFTVAWCHGQTIGKRLMQIKVIQLDGKELKLLAAFSRQGGYGAGFATGMLGFLQVYWDPNRQAIQDKVASTVVIRLHQPKRPLSH